MINIIASTTRQWNCGDEFILFGVQNLIEKVMKDRINWCIYDRNPDIMSKTKIQSNSFRDYPLKNIDHIVVAGSPEWFGNPLHSLFRSMKNEDKSAIFLGVGYIRDSISFCNEDKHILGKSPLITTRDSNAQIALKRIGVNSHKMVCPAFFASKDHHVRRKQRIGLVWQNSRVGNQLVSEDLSKATLAVYKQIVSANNAAVICHYVDEYFVAMDHFEDVHFSYDARDYLDIYKDFDIVVSTRLHGAVLAMSLGIPSILVVKKSTETTTQFARCAGTADLFPCLMVCNPEEINEKLNMMNIQRQSEMIIQFKEQQMQKYLNVLSSLAA